MNRLTENFNRVKKVVIPYITPDFPFNGVTEPLLKGFDDAGIPIVELGIPFSDPLADGPTIQQSSMRALENGVTLDRVLELSKWTYENTSIAVVLMGYVNPILQMGADNFFRKAKDAHVQGLIIPDIPQDEAGPFITLAEEYGLAMVFLVAPTTKPERIRQISANSQLFSYCVSMNGVTGNRGLDPVFMESVLAQVRQFHDKPFVVGFGIQTESDVRSVLKNARGAVVGSALIRALDNGKTVDEAVQSGLSFFKPLAGVANEF